MTQNFFDRYEDKYIISQSQYDALISLLNLHGHIDSYGKYPISSAYLDNIDFGFAKKAIQNPLNNQKIRLRKYSHKAFSTSDTLMYELKERKNGKVQKHRTIVSPSSLSTSVPLLTPLQKNVTFKSIQKIQQTNNLYLQLIVKYQRSAYVFKSHPDLRVTFDTSISCEHFCPALINHTKTNSYSLLSSNQYLMEIKYDNTIPSWLSNIIEENKIVKSSFSKYVTSYTKLYESISG